MSEIGSYSPGHPWFYILGGTPPSLEAIRAHVEQSGYKGYRSEIAAIDGKPEPKRTAALQRLQAEVMREMEQDVQRYREVVRELARYRPETPEKPICNNLHTSVSLKYNHLYNDFAHLIQLERLKSPQRSLFDI